MIISPGADPSVHMSQQSDGKIPQIVVNLNQSKLDIISPKKSLINGFYFLCSYYLDRLRCFLFDFFFLSFLGVGERDLLDEELI